MITLKKNNGRYCIFVDGKDTGKWASTEAKAKEIGARFGSAAPPPPPPPPPAPAPDCSWCGAECARPFPNARGEVFCSPAHRSASNRALSRLVAAEPAPRRTASPEKVIGFTGTREGMTHRQKATVLRLFIENMPFTFVHGDCVGADDNAHDLAIRVGAPVVQRPCTLTSQRAFGAGAKKVYPPKPPLDRNREIVTGSDLMIATPKGFVEEQRGGTWYTIRYARQTETPLIIVWPDGSTGS